jgi:NADH dehydrogenase (ubiquinone) 1 alpha subcomplex subunit 8
VIQADTTCSLANKELFDLTPLPDSIPKVKEIGATSAPLMSAAFFIGARCRPFNDDYMKCKEDAEGRGELECMKEGRKVTRCAQSVYVNSSTRLQKAQGMLTTNI